ncbi:MAG: nucleotidyltransferase protein [Flavipsychrobacter sp.]|nr:nucleotidyltransferase protein [Flavipsychrobacter sp.]
MNEIQFPTELHKSATTAVRDFFTEQENIDTILLVNSIARGKGTPDSDIDIAILVDQGIGNAEIQALENKWLEFYNSESTISSYKQSNRFAQIHMDIIHGEFAHTIWEVGGINDYYEIEIGNRLIYSMPLTGEGVHFKFLQSQLLPYYDEKLRMQRLQMVRDAFAYDIEHISVLVKRELYFHAFDILFKAFQEFMQLLFMKHKTYPIAYNKWIKEQVVDILKLPELYKQLPGIISVNNLESNELIDKAKHLSLLLNEYCTH